MHILVVEDDRTLQSVLRMGLTQAGHTVEVATDGDTGERLATDSVFDVLIVDWMIPGIDGFTLIQQLRRKGLSVPILMLTARTDVQDRIDALNAGADDYLTKPFAFGELLARLQALGRRNAYPRPEYILEAGPLRMDLLRREVTMAGARIELQPREYLTLEFLMRRSGSVVTRTVLAESVWGSVPGTSDDAINMTISRLRSRLMEGNRSMTRTGRVEIRTVRGVGYRLAFMQSKGRELLRLEDREFYQEMSSVSYS